MKLQGFAKPWLGPVIGTILGIAFLGLLHSCFSSSPNTPDVSGEDPHQGDLVSRLRPLCQELGPPQPGDWLLSHSEEGQSFREYVAASPVRATALLRQSFCMVEGRWATDVVMQQFIKLLAKLGVRDRLFILDGQLV